MLQLKRLIAFTVAVPIHRCSQVKGRVDTPLPVGATDLGYIATAIKFITSYSAATASVVVEIHSEEMVALLMSDVKPGRLTLFGGSVDVATFHPEVDVLFSAANICRYEEWTYTKLWM